jgi:LysM repeat protein
MILRKISQTTLLLSILWVLLASGDRPVSTFAMEARDLVAKGQDQSYDPYALIAEVNALRAANGLTELNPDPILMSVSQAHADYMASIGSVTHYSADGSRPFQRSLAAGYPVAGDLNLGGFHSENIIAGTNMTPAEAVSQWTGDEPHLTTMLSPQYVDIGAGVSMVGNKIYYVIDTSRKSGSAVPAYTPHVVNGTPVVNLNPLVSTIFPSTPASDGSVIHQVRPGETLWLIAITYGVKIDEILALNNLPKDSPIYPKQELIIKKALATPSPTTSLADTPTLESSSTPTATLWTATLPPAQEEIEATSLDSKNRQSSFLTPLVIVAGALTVAGLVAFTSGRRRRE